MMNKKILAIDCSLRLTGVALIDGERIIASDVQDLGRRQAAELPLMTERLLHNSHWQWSDINFIAVTSGPGYFTGLRVGAAYATGLAFGLGVKIIPVPSLEILALSYLNETANGEILVIVYAGKNAVYATSFSGSTTLPLGEYTGEELSDWLVHHKEVTIISDAPERAMATVNLTFPVEAVRPDISCIAFAVQKYKPVPPEKLQLIYCRTPQGT